jgi:nucleoside-diphosphate-sugar epimerase
MILLTGSNGSIGRNIAADHRLNLRFPLQVQEIKEALPFTTEATLIHLAGISNPETVESDPVVSFSVNVQSTLNLFKAFAEKNGQRFIFASTSHVYGSTQDGAFSREQDQPNPQSRYAEQKIEAEQKLKALATNFNTEVVILRIFSVFGSGMRENFLSGRIEKHFNVHGAYPIVHSADDVRDFSTPLEMSGYISLTTDIHVDKMLTLNLCSGKAKTVREQIKLSYCDFPNSNFVPGNSHTPRLVGDNSLMRKYLRERPD